MAFKLLAAWFISILGFYKRAFGVWVVKKTHQVKANHMKEKKRKRRKKVPKQVACLMELGFQNILVAIKALKNPSLSVGSEFHHLSLKRANFVYSCRFAF